MVARSTCNSEYFVERKACPVCLSNETETLYSSPYIEDPVRAFVLSHYKGQGEVNLDYLRGTDFTLCDCKACGTLYQQNAPNGFLLDKVYNEMISATTLFPRELNSLTIAMFNSIAGELTELFARVRKRPSEIRLLDYGFGYGAWARVAVALGAQVYATEISPEKIAFGKQIGVKMIGEDELAALQFDIVHTEQVFEHLTEPRADFFKLAARVAPGGIMKVAVPPAGNIRGLLKSRGMAAVSPLESDWQTPAERSSARQNAAYMCVVPLEHLNVFSAKAIERLGREAGLSLVGTARKQAVPVSMTDGRRLLKSLSQLGRVTARVILDSLRLRESGYYILARQQ
jgi:SAM-dependent methyltransferase